MPVLLWAADRRRYPTMADFSRDRSIGSAGRLRGRNGRSKLWVRTEGSSKRHSK